MEELIQKAATLHEALPYIKRFHGQIFVVKYGGHAMVDPALSNSFARDVVLLKYVGIHPVLVHGGGPQIDNMLKSLGVVSEKLHGVRVTDERTMDVVEMVLGGSINADIVSLIMSHGGRAVGLTGRDDDFLRATKITELKTKDGKTVDPGRVGEIESVRPDVLQRLIQTGFIPVIAPIAVDANGQALNVNADLVAGRVAEALQASKLLLLTDTQGVQDDKGKMLRSLHAKQIESLSKKGIIRDGMIPKVNCALDALRGGVQKAHIIDGRVLHAILLEIFTDQGIGTEILAS